MSLRIATYNFLQGGSTKRYGHLSRLIREYDPNIVLCQEARPSDQLSLEDVEDLRSQAFFWRKIAGNRWGSGILVRGFPALKIQVLGFEGWVIGAEIQLERRTRVFSIHCPAGEKGYVHTMHGILDAIAPLSSEVDLIIGGDFNVAVGLRSAGETLKISRAEVELLERIGAEFGLVPCWQSANPGTPLGQTLRWSADRSAPYHCDGIFIPAAWQSRLRTCQIVADSEWERLSDHNPVVAELDLQIAPLPGLTSTSP